MPDGYKLVMDGAAMAEMLRSPSGPVGRHLIERATIVQAAARQQAPESAAGGDHEPGCLRDSIVKRAERYGEDLAIRIQSDTTSCSPDRLSYSLFVHEGTEAHDIFAKPGGVLAFNWPGGPTGGMFFATAVHHPGTEANRYLTDNLHLAVAG